LHIDIKQDFILSQKMEEKKTEDRRQKQDFAPSVVANPGGS
jgi:hypothetical protein